MELGPEGDFWRTWYTEVRNRGDDFVLYTTDKQDREFHFADGGVANRSRYWRYFTLSTVADNALIAGLAFLFGLLCFLLAVGYWRRRREMRRPHPA